MYGDESEKRIGKGGAMVKRYNGIPQFELILNDSGCENNVYESVKEKYQYIETSAHPFEDVFKSLKVEHTRLFIPLINEVFGTDYSLDEKIELLPSEGVTLTPANDGTADVKKRVTDMIVKIRDKLYIIECQSDNDSTMVIRLAEYAFMGALRNAVLKDGIMHIKMPKYTVLYVRSNSKTPRKTRIKVSFPTGEVVDYYSDNILMKEITKEEIVDKRLYALVPFYILRYEEAIKKNKANIDVLEAELRYFSEHLNQEMQDGTFYYNESRDIKYLSNNLIRKVFGDENVENAERLVNVMGGNVVWMPSIAEREGRAKGHAEGKAEGITQMTHAFKLLKTGKCTTVDELLDNGVSLEIANAVLSI